MRVRDALGLALPVTLLFLAAGSGLAGGLQPTGSSGGGAGAPWFIDMVDPTATVGSHASVAIDPDTGTTYISYLAEVSS